MPRAPHGQMLVLATGISAWRKLVCMYDEEANPLRRKKRNKADDWVRGFSAPAAVKRYTVEFYFPLRAGVDRVQKFMERVQAIEAVHRELEQMMSDFQRIEGDTRDALARLGTRSDERVVRTSD